jgi:hypothetical protein
LIFQSSIWASLSLLGNYLSQPCNLLGHSGSSNFLSTNIFPCQLLDFAAGADSRSVHLALERVRPVLGKVSLSGTLSWLVSDLGAKELWKSKVSNKCRFFVWLVLHGLDI